MQALREPTRDDIDARRGKTVVEFGSAWCGYCRAAQPAIAAALGGRDDIAHVKVEDGPGQPLGRSFRVKLWPTLVFVADGREVARVVRPTGTKAVADAIAALDAA